MDDEFEYKIKSEFKAIFEEKSVIDCDSGWYELIAAFCRCAAGESGIIHNVYQKDGLLTISLNPAHSQRCRELIGAADALREASRTICEICGEKGGMCKKDEEKKVLCIDHAESEGFSIFD